MPAMLDRLYFYVFCSMNLQIDFWSAGGIIVSNSISLLYFRTAAILLIVGMVFGIYMSASGNHAATGAHAHLNLIGFVVMSIYGIFFGLNPQRSGGRLPKILWGLNTVAAVVMFPSLALLLYGHPSFEPIVAIAALLALAGAILFAVILFRTEAA